MLTIIFYILLFGLSDFIIYSLINKRKYINAKLIFSFTLGIIILLLLHTGVIYSNNLLSNKILFIVLEMLFTLVFVNISGNFLIDRTLKSQRLSEQDKTQSVKLLTLVFTKMIYIVIFIGQVFLATASP
jgi:hypothetical protein